VSGLHTCHLVWTGGYVQSADGNEQHNSVPDPRLHLEGEHLEIWCEMVSLVRGGSGICCNGLRLEVLWLGALGLVQMGKVYWEGRAGAPDMVLWIL